MRELLCAGAALAGLLPALAAAASQADPTLEQVLAASDDVDVNIAYARTQADAGRLLSAAAALERVLMARPNAAAVRLMYAVVLYRLDDLQAADAQLALTDPATLSALERRELEKYRRLVANGRKDTRFTGQLSAGVVYNSNAVSELLTLYDNPFLHKEAAEGFVVSGILDGSVKVGGTDHLALFGSLSGYSRDAFSGPEDKLQYLTFAAGIRDTEQRSSWQAAGVLDNYWLFGESFLTEYGGRVGESWRVGPATTIGGAFEAVWQDYDEPAIDAVKSILGGTHDGLRTKVEGRAVYRFDSRSTIGLTAGYEMHTAGYKPFSYDAPFVGVDYHALLGSGAYLDLAGALRWIDFRAVDPIFLAGVKDKRSDSYDMVRATLGVPLSAFSNEGATADVLEDLVIETSLTYTSRRRPLPLADYSGTGAELRLVWHFGDDR